MRIEKQREPYTIQHFISVFTSILFTLCLTTTAANADDRYITLIQVSDLHGNMLPHAGIINNSDGTTRAVTQGGGISKVATIVKRIREDNPDSLTLGVGDTTHGTAEVLFTMGDAIMPALNALGLDAYTPGNWDFAYGPVVFRHRFASRPPFPPIPANVRVMIDADGTPGVSKVNFPVLAINLYNAAPVPPQLRGKRILDPFKIFDLDGTKVAVIGITASIVPQQAPAFSIGMLFTQAYTELPGIIEQVTNLGADIVVLQSELGLPQNVQLGREFRDIDVILSAHSHEVTLGAILADGEGYVYTTPGKSISSAQKQRLKAGAAIIIEAGEDLYVGRLDLKIAHGKIKDFDWQAIPVDDDVDEDPTVKKLVDQQEEAFIAGEDGEVTRHSFLPVGFCPANVCDDTSKRGLQLTDDLDTVVGNTEVLLQRQTLLEGIMNNFIADAIKTTLDPVVAAQTTWQGIDISMTNGFRFDTPVLSANEVPADAVFRDGRATGEITLRDLYSYFPISPALVAAQFKGDAIEKSLEVVLEGVFNRNPFLQKGGWYLGLSSNISQKIDVINAPASTSGKRIIETKINGQKLDPSKTYVLGSCYGHSFPVGRTCRTSGGAHPIYFELANPDNYSSAINVTSPVNSEKIFGFGPPKQVAPDGYLHPVHTLRRLLDSLPDNRITEAQFGIGRVVHVDSRSQNNDPSPLPKPDIPGVIQPLEGLGPKFLKRNVQIIK